MDLTADLPVSSFTYINFCFIHFETVLCASVLSSSVMSDTLRPHRTVACQAPLSMELPRQEYWSGCHFLLQGIFLTQGSNPHLLHRKGIVLLLRHQGSLYIYKQC